MDCGGVEDEVEGGGGGGGGGGGFLRSVNALGVSVEVQVESRNCHTDGGAACRLGPCNCKYREREEMNGVIR